MPPLPLVLEPDPDDPDCAVPIVAVTVAGRPYRFVLDTGAACTTMAPDAYTSALPVSGRGRSHGAFAPTSDPFVTVTDLRAGPMHVTELKVALAEGNWPGAPNLLGMDVLRRYRCHFRFGRGVVEVGPEAGTEAGTEAGAEAGQAAAPVTMNDLWTSAACHPHVDVEWPGVTAHACWDSGAGITVVNRDFWLAHRELFDETGTVTGTDVGGARRETTMLRMSRSVIGCREFGAHKAVVVDLTAANSSLERPMDLILGYPAWRQADWLFDFPARKWALTGAAGTC
jgi:hypothetical protein